jgi:HKD family nuclease
MLGSFNPRAMRMRSPVCALITFSAGSKKMLVSGKGYREAISDLLQSADSADIAVAFWGAGGESIFKGWSGSSARIVCTLMSGATNPAVIEQLRKNSKLKAEIRQCDDLHAKLVLTERELIVGSANISANGLGLEESEVSGWQELGIRSSDRASIEAAGHWFKAIWESSRAITNDDLSTAKEVWAKRRGIRPFVKKRELSLLFQPAEIFKDRPIYVVVWRDELSKDAEKKYDDLVKEIKQQGGRLDLDLYEGWDEGELPIDPSAVIIPVEWSLSGKIDVAELERPLPEFADSHVVNRKRVRLDYFATATPQAFSDLGIVFAKKDIQSIKNEIRPWLETLAELKTTPKSFGVCKPLYDFLRWREEHPPRSGEA